MTMSRQVFLPLAIAAAIALAGCGQRPSYIPARSGKITSGKITKANADKLTNGMTIQEVCAILGSPNGGVVKAAPPGETGMPPEEVSLWSEGQKEITVTFVDGRVTGVSFQDARADRAKEQESFWPEPGLVGALAVRGNHAYVGIGPRLIVVDISEPGRLAVVGHAGYWPKQGFPARATGVATAIALSGNHALVTHYLGSRVADHRYEADVDTAVFDISNASAPALAGTYQPPRPPAKSSGQALGVAVSGQYAYVYRTTGLDVLDVSRPSSPKRVGQWATPAQPGSGISIPVFDGLRGRGRQVSVAGPHIALAGDRVYLADRSGGLRILDASDPAAPKEIGSCGTRGYATGVVVEGKHAFVAVNDGLRIIDVSHPSRPKEVGSFTQDRLVGAVPRGGYAFVYGPRIDYVDGRHCGGLRVLDVSDPASPKEVHPPEGQVPIVDGDVIALVLEDKYAYMGVGRHLVVADVSDPANPKVVGSTAGRVPPQTSP